MPSFSRTFHASTGISSGPAAFAFFIFFRALSISTLVTSLVTSQFGTPSTVIVLGFSSFSRVAKYVFHLSVIFSISVSTSFCPPIICFICVRFLLALSLLLAILKIFFTPYGVCNSLYSSSQALFLLPPLLSLLLSLPLCTSFVHFFSRRIPQLLESFLSNHVAMHFLVPLPSLFIYWCIFTRYFP